MRKLLFAINITLDGCCDHTKVNPHEDVHRYFTELMRESGTLLYGRKTYQLMVPFWPEMARSGSAPSQSMKDFAVAFDAVPNVVVFSRTLDPSAVDSKTRVVRDNLREEVRKLKQQSGRDISLGGVDLPSQMVELGLIDEYRFMVHPIVAGEGRRLFDNINLTEKLQLRLADSRTLPSGYVALRYVKP